MAEDKGCVNCAIMDQVGDDDPCPNLRACIVDAPKGKELSYWRPKKAPRQFNEGEVEKLIEQAYLNGIAAAGMARYAGRAVSDNGYKSSTAYYEFTQMVKRGG